MLPFRMARKPAAWSFLQVRSTSTRTCPTQKYHSTFYNSNRKTHFRKGVRFNRLTHRPAFSSDIGSTHSVANGKTWWVENWGRAHKEVIHTHIKTRPGVFTSQINAIKAEHAKKKNQEIFFFFCFHQRHASTQEIWIITQIHGLHITYITDQP